MSYETPPPPLPPTSDKDGFFTMISMLREYFTSKLAIVYSVMELNERLLI